MLIFCFCFLRLELDLKPYNEKLHASHWKKYYFNHLEVEDQEKVYDSADRGCVHEILITSLNFVMSSKNIEIRLVFVVQFWSRINGITSPVIGKSLLGSTECFPKYHSPWTIWRLISMLFFVLPSFSGSFCSPPGPPLFL